MKLNFPNYIQNLKLPLSKALFPLYEAISNSMDAIDEHKEQISGEIIIVIERVKQIVMEDTEDLRERLPIRHITIIDNGVGFRIKNFNSFSELSSSKKKERGGKGLGRVSWLKVFKSAEIKSTYSRNGATEHISFEFSCEDKSINNVVINENTSQKISTEVKLLNCKKTYVDAIPKKRLTIAEEIIRHFLPNFMVSSVPDILIKEEGLEDISVNQVFEDYISEEGEKTKITIQGHEFDVMHAKTRYHSQRNKDHRVYFIANGRVVESEPISQEKVNNIPSKLKIKDENHVYIGYVESPYLDEKVNQSRDAFDIPKFFQDGQMFIDLDWEKIQNDVYQSVGDYLSDYIEQAKLLKDEKIRKFIKNEAPNYTYLYKLHKKELEKISFKDIEKGRLERELHKIHVSLKTKLSNEVKKLLSVPEGEISPKEYQKKVSGLVEKLNPTGKADLAEYIMYRKIILDLLGEALKKNNDEKYSTEDVIHGYIFPIRKSSDEVTHDKHNLWLLDERLSFNTYIASDKQFGQIPGFEKLPTTEKRKRPDLFAAALATVEPNETISPYKTLDVFEFKRPMRNEYNDDENPHSQIIEYLKIIRNNKAINKDGRVFSVVGGGVIYCHIICDITPKLRDFLDKDDFEQIGEEDWYIKFHKNYNAIIEVKSFEYVLETASKRNNILFEKLGIN